MAHYKLKNFLFVIDAKQWHKNGDHPLDYVGDTQGFEKGELRTFTGEERKTQDWEGSVVRYYRHPAIDGESLCKECGVRMHEHGWIDTKADPDGVTVCPGDYVFADSRGDHHTMRPALFTSLYDAL